MYRFLFRPIWMAFHLLVVAAAITMIGLGSWQLDRLDQRRAFNEVIVARYDETPVALSDLVPPGTEPADDGLESAEWRPVTASGTYLPDAAVSVVNRSQNGRAGRNLAVPLRLDDGRVLFVNRGFVPLTVDPLPVPAVDVEILGRLRTSSTRSLGQLSDPAEGVLTEVQRIDLDRLAEQTPGDLVPMYVDLVSSIPAEPEAFPEPVARPELGEGNHLSYAVQWFVFSAAVVVGWFLAVRRSVRSRHRTLERVDVGETDRGHTRVG